MDTDEFRRLAQSRQPDYDVFTVGNEKNYDRGIAEHGITFVKTGRSPGYPGGFAVHTPQDAERLIDEQGKRGEWAVYALAAFWHKDTAPSPDGGWWRALINDAQILRKIPTPDEH